jgi:hypothetical protein
MRPFIAKAFPGPERLRAVHLLHVAGPSFAGVSWCWAKVGPQKLIDSGLALHLLLSFHDFRKLFMLCRPGSGQITGTPAVNR